MTSIRYTLLIAGFVGAMTSTSPIATAFPERAPSSVMEPMQLTQVHYRRHRLCSWRQGHRHCPGIRHGYAPIYLHFGHHGHHGHHFGYHGHGHSFGHGGHHGHH